MHIEAESTTQNPTSIQRGEWSRARPRNWDRAKDRADDDVVVWLSEVSDQAELQHCPLSLSPDRPGWTVRAEGIEVDLMVSVVVPAFNEARNLPAVLLQVPYEGTELIVVDGRSTDASLDVIRELRPDARVVMQEGKKGKGDALRLGFEAATGDIVVMIDADGSMSPREIPMFIDALVGGADVAKGSRTLPGGGSADLTFVRSLGNWGLGQVFNRLYGVRHSDLCYGYMAFWRRHLDVMNPDCDGFEVETLLNVRAAQAALRVVEVPSHEGRRTFGESNLRPVRDGMRVLRTMLVERFASRRRKAVGTVAPA